MSIAAAYPRPAIITILRVGAIVGLIASFIVGVQMADASGGALLWVGLAWLLPGFLGMAFIWAASTALTILHDIRAELSYHHRSSRSSE